MEDEEIQGQVGGGYPFGQLAKAFVTAQAHEDEETRTRAERRIDRWAAVLKGMASGRLSIGSRTPVAELPAWVTPEVIRGGFATGSAAAGGSLQPHEKAAIERAGLSGGRAGLFAYYLTEPGLGELDSMLTSGAYEVSVPEEAALLTVAWLVRTSETGAALDLVDVLMPFADRLRFAPILGDPPETEPSVVFRDTAGAARKALAKRRENQRVETMREALAVWNPFADELLELWLETVRDGGVTAELPAGWDDRARALLARYEELAATHTRCRKHRKPKENLAILRTSLSDQLSKGVLPVRQRGLLQHAVNSMLKRRGEPGSPKHTALRESQAANAALPTHHALAKVVAARLAALPQQRGVKSPEPLTVPVTTDEARERGLAAGTPIPASIQSVVNRTLAATPEVLIERRVVPSAEVLAELVPRIAASTVSAAYSDGSLRKLVAANYEAFRRRRSLLLLNLEHQVTIEKLPWMQAVAAVGEGSEDTHRESTAAVARLAELALEAFPATIMPSPLVTELGALADEADLDLPLVEELAADIFMGSFSAKFLAAAKLAARLLHGSLYERYYGINYAEILAINDVTKKSRHSAQTSPTFDALCIARAGTADRGLSVAANGKIIEQAQVLTTHNLATLTGPYGIGEHMQLDWFALATKCLHATTELSGRLQKNPRPLRTVKDLAYAWRQMVFFLARADPHDQSRFLATAHEQLQTLPDHAGARLRPALAGLEHVIRGGAFNPDGSADSGRRLLGWTTDTHWMLLNAR